MLICKEIIFRQHALKRMIERNISFDEIEFGVKNGENIKNYSEDKPFESQLLFVNYNGKIFHLLVSKDEMNQICYIITVYLPDTDVWKDDYKTRK
ncbi:MAG TPA: DUF4258 domain-containing protein [Chitinophagales bacterium]|jgi:hypothetical protein|nr:DUF4258 domain-containing protein [Chitinophagales bacterium]MBP6154374.1 DUF4258 domain-containing protein [Chitinophagales bacterium]HQV78791.1 DUF4258 domain-containing protein [Chitinophagales bacterium]HQW79157.1 DUF4258 domain-containing protein [Chitinophagales bacterium]